MEKKTEVKAFNYQTQQWESGAAAIATRRAQLEQDLELLTGPKAAQFAKFVGIPDVAGALASIRAELSTLR